MKSSHMLIMVSLVIAATTFAYAGPGPQYWTQRQRERTALPAKTTAETTAAAQQAPSCCRVVAVQRPVASHKVSVMVRTVECSGCAAMAAGEKCPTS